MSQSRESPRLDSALDLDGFLGRTKLTSAAVGWVLSVLVYIKFYSTRCTVYMYPRNALLTINVRLGVAHVAHPLVAAAGEAAGIAEEGTREV